MLYNLGTMERKIKLYLDISIINFAVDDRTPVEKLLTQKLIEEIKAGKYEVFISEVVLLEINKSAEEKRKEGGRCDRRRRSPSDVPLGRGTRDRPGRRRR
mgnify:CR=1 FL=1